MWRAKASEEKMRIAHARVFGETTWHFLAQACANWQCRLPQIGAGVQAFDGVESRLVARWCS
jgi:hypothetical protein